MSFCSVFFLFALLPAACRTGIDESRATTCRRALPAIAPRDAAIHILRIGLGPAEDSVRIEYGLSGPPEIVNWSHWIVCGFGPRTNLISIMTESGPLGQAALFLLKRHYLETPEAKRANPGR